MKHAIKAERVRSLLSAAERSKLISHLRLRFNKALYTCVTDGLTCLRGETSVSCTRETWQIHLFGVSALVLGAEVCGGEQRTCTSSALVTRLPSKLNNRALFNFLAKYSATTTQSEHKKHHESRLPRAERERPLGRKGSGRRQRKKPEEVQGEKMIDSTLTIDACFLPSVPCLEQINFVCFYTREIISFARENLCQITL